MSDETSPTSSPSDYPPEVLANLAAKFIPTIYLPPDWERNPWDIERASHDEIHGTTEQIGEHRINLSIKGPTPFEMVAEAAVARARVLLDVASGRKRKERLEAEAEESEYEARSGTWSATAEKQQAKFDRKSKGGDFLPVIEALREAWPDVVRAAKRTGKEEFNLFYYYRAFLKAEADEKRKRLNFPRLRVVFADKASAADKANAVSVEARVAPPACIILMPPEEQKVSHHYFPHLIFELQNFKGSARKPTSQWSAAFSRLQKMHGYAGEEAAREKFEEELEREVDVWGMEEEPEARKPKTGGS